MYGHRFEYPDGHIWELVYIEPGASRAEAVTAGGWPGQPGHDEKPGYAARIAKPIDLVHYDYYSPWGYRRENMAAREAKRLFGQLLDDAQRTPVKIDRHGRTVAVVVSSAEYDRLATYRQHLLSQVAQGGQGPTGNGRAPVR